MTGTNRGLRAAMLAMRGTLAIGFLSAVADRLGIWGPPGTPGVAWGTFDSFLAYTGRLLWYLPPAGVTMAGSAATILEVLLAVGLLVGIRLRFFALASGLLLVSFAAAMTVALGFEPPLSFSVWTAAAGAFVLAAIANPPIRG